MVSHSREQHNNYYRNVLIHIIILIKSCENFCLHNVLKRSHSMTCLPENVCKFFCLTTFVASVSMMLVFVSFHLSSRQIDKNK
ncbi:hypothetical protein T10_12587 [Trichinella papuae]|uniref:Uncharacterized protein n=1 Tax=Trichinella papuae TaxID=268474 RepID=A0A0V1MWJ9_9BILA|nr:hypothetical protein T10_12587 [Trichinella papuae]